MAGSILGNQMYLLTDEQGDQYVVSMNRGNDSQDCDLRELLSEHVNDFLDIDLNMDEVEIEAIDYPPRGALQLD